MPAWTLNSVSSTQRDSWPLIGCPFPSLWSGNSQTVTRDIHWAHLICFYLSATAFLCCALCNVWEPLFHIFLSIFLVIWRGRVNLVSFILSLPEASQKLFQVNCVSSKQQQTENATLKWHPFSSINKIRSAGIYLTKDVRFSEYYKIC